MMSINVESEGEENNGYDVFDDEEAMLVRQEEDSAAHAHTLTLQSLSAEIGSGDISSISVGGQEPQSEASNTDSSRFESDENELIRQEASVEAETRALALREWEEISRRGPMRIMVAGLGGVGKSTLVNRLFGLGQEENLAEEGYTGKATTKAVRSYRHELKNGVEAIIFDTPGLDDSEKSEHRILAEMKVETREELDLLLYCVSVGNPGARVAKADIRALCLLTNVFGPSLWKNAIFIATFANLACMWKEKDHYFELIETTREELRRHIIKSAGVPQKIADDIPLVTAGHVERVIKHEQEEWIGKLYGELLKRNLEITTALLKGQISNKEQFVALIIATVTTVASTGGGAGVGAGIGAGIGAGVGAVGGPIGIGLGAVIGSAVGGGLSLIFSGTAAVVGTVAWRRKKYTDKLGVAQEVKKMK